MWVHLASVGTPAVRGSVGDTIVEQVFRARVIDGDILELLLGDGTRAATLRVGEKAVGPISSAAELDTPLAEGDLNRVGNGEAPGVGDVEVHAGDIVSIAVEEGGVDVRSERRRGENADNSDDLLGELHFVRGYESRASREISTLLIFFDH